MFRITMSSQVTMGSLVVVIVSLYCCAPEALGQRIRQNYRALSPAARLKFRDALVAMKADTSDTGVLKECTSPLGKLCNNNAECDSGATCGTGADCTWSNKFDKYVCWHDRCGCIFQGGSQHGRPRILPWHRELLRRFEEDLRAISGFEDVTIPYWKWTDPFPSHLDDNVQDNNFMGSTNTGYFHSICSAPAASVGDFCTNDVDCDTSPGNGVCDLVWITRVGGDGLETRSHASAVGTFDQTEIVEALSKALYDKRDADPGADGWVHPGSRSSDEFRPYLESLHNSMHVWVGGDLLNPASAADDPVFWMAHAFFDCMWAAWEDSHNPDYRPDVANFPADAPTPQGEDADDVLDPWNLKTIRDVLDVQVLGYNYDVTHDKQIPPVAPTVSEWGVVALSLLMLTGIAIKFGRRRVVHG